MVLQTQKQLLMPAAQEGADKDELDIITQELDMDLDADEDNSDLDMLDSDDDGNHSFTTSSTLHCSWPPPSSWPPLAAAASKHIVPAKRKHASSKKKSAEFVDDKDEDLGPGKPDHPSIQCVSSWFFLPVPPPEGPILKIGYILSIYSSAQMKLAKSKHEAVGRSLELESKEPWSTVSVQILVQIDDALSITNFDINNYKISYTIPHHVSQPLPLTSVTSYAHLIANTTKGKTPTLSAKLTVIQKATQVHKQIYLWIYFSNYEHFRTTKTRRIVGDLMPKIQRTRRELAT